MGWCWGGCHGGLESLGCFAATGDGAWLVLGALVGGVVSVVLVNGGFAVVIGYGLRWMVWACCGLYLVVLWMFDTRRFGGFAAWVVTWWLGSVIVICAWGLLIS